MALVVEFDAKNNILRGTLEGRMTGAILLDLHARATRYMASRPSCRGILDFSKVTDCEVSSAALRQVAASPPVFSAGYMRVLVIPRDFIYGLARMFQILTEETRPELRVVRTMEEAYRLLEVSSPGFEPVHDVEST